MTKVHVNVQTANCCLRWQRYIASLVLAAASIYGEVATGAWPEDPHLETFASATNSSTYDFGNVSIPADGLLVVWAASRQTSDRAVSSIEIGGAAGEIVATSGAALLPTAIAAREVATGNHNLTINFSGGSVLNCTAVVYLLPFGTYASSAQPVTESVSVAGTSLDVSLVYPAGGFAIYGAIRPANNVATDYTAAIEAHDEWNEHARYSSAWKVASGSDTETISWDSSQQHDNRAIAAVWAPKPSGRLFRELLESNYSQTKPLAPRLDPLCRAFIHQTY